MEKVLIDAGLGPDYGELRLDRTTEGWVAAGSSLQDQVAAILEGDATGVERTAVARLPASSRPLRGSSDARSKYEAVKLRLMDEFGGDRNAYTDGKSDVVRSLLGELE